MPLDSAPAPTKYALFRLEDGALVPQDIARSLWKADQMHGVATCGALGRAVELGVRTTGRDDVRPARFTVDLFRAPSMSPCRTEATVVREGSRLVLVDAQLVQDDVVDPAVPDQSDHLVLEDDELLRGLPHGHAEEGE